MFGEWKRNKCGGNWRDVWFSQVYVVSDREKNEKYGHVNKLVKSISVYKRKKKKRKKMHKHNKIWSWHYARKKKKEVEKNKSEIKHLGLVENRSRPRIGRTSWSSVLLVLGALY